jgi:hypothetical protein
MCSRAASLLVVLAACGRSATEAGPPDASTAPTIACRPLAVGDVLHVTAVLEGSTRGPLHIDGKLQGMSHFKLSENVDYAFEVLALSAGTPSRGKLRYAARTSYDLNGALIRWPVEGKGYVVDLERVTDEKGKPVPDAEAREVQVDVEYIKDIRSVPCGVALTRDQKVEVTGGWYVFRGLVDGTARFDFGRTGKRTGHIGLWPASLEVAYEGKMRLDPKGALAVDMEGPTRVSIAFTEKNHAIAGSATGPTHMSVSITR